MVLVEVEGGAARAGPRGRYMRHTPHRQTSDNPLTSPRLHDGCACACDASSRLPPHRCWWSLTGMYRVAMAPIARLYDQHRCDMSVSCMHRTGELMHSHRRMHSCSTVPCISTAHVHVSHACIQFNQADATSQRMQTQTQTHAQTHTMLQHRHSGI